MLVVVAPHVSKRHKDIWPLNNCLLFFPLSSPSPLALPTHPADWLLPLPIYGNELTRICMAFPTTSKGGGEEGKREENSLYPLPPIAGGKARRKNTQLQAPASSGKVSGVISHIFLFLPVLMLEKNAALYPLPLLPSSRERGESTSTYVLFFLKLPSRSGR